MSMAYREIIVEVEQEIALLTLNRPAQLNTLGTRMVAELEAALSAIETAVDARVLILTGAGERAFSAGVDLKERRALSDDQRWEHNRALSALVEHLARLQIPTIAALNGLALGGAFELTLACDFRIAAEHVQIGSPEVGIGIIPGAGATQRLPRLIGPARAKELILTGRRIPAQQALEWGLFSEVMPGERLLPAARAFATEIARNSPLALAYAKAAVDLALETSLEQGLRYETGAIRATLASEDYQIGLRAFAEKTAPQFPPLTTRRIV